MTYQQSIVAGSLDINTTRASYPLDTLVTFASRENPKRGFLFVSKILGKHWPVRPNEMRRSYDDLVAMLPGDRPTYVVGMAETATGLGAGVADSLARRQSSPVHYQHTTRTHIDDYPIWLQLDEAHSHAVDHIVYQPQPQLLPAIQRSERLVLVDDEISTGRTLRLLADKLIPLLSSVKEVVVVSLINWLDDDKIKPFTTLPVPVSFVSLFEGQFTFTANPDFQPVLPSNVDRALSMKASRLDLGRLAMRMPYRGALPKLDISQPLTVLGEGEHLYLPFLCAEHAEQQGQDVLFQSTTRSPILPGDGIAAKLEFAVDHRSVVHYLYNFAADGRTVMMFMENEDYRDGHELARQYPIREVSHD